MKKIGLFSKFRKKNTKPPAFVFVDYEHWFVSMYKKYAMKPRVREWRDRLAEDYDLREITFFGDFSNPGMRSEIPRIRQVTNLIIDTQNTSPYYKKDFTDFIMLDCIYQKALISADMGVDTFIIFTGDGHFSSVVKFLKDKCGKKVIIYAVKDGLSGMLRSVCSEYCEVPDEDEIMITYYSMIAYTVDDLKKGYADPLKEPSFISVVGTVSDTYGMDREYVKELANAMVKKGYLTVSVKRVSPGKRVSMVKVDREAAERDGVRLITDASLFPLPQKNDKNSRGAATKKEKNG